MRYLVAAMLLAAAPNAVRGQDAFVDRVAQDAGGRRVERAPQLPAPDCTRLTADSVGLVLPGIFMLDVWGIQQPVWRRLDLTGVRDTVVARLVGVACGTPPTRIYVERDGWTFQAGISRLTRLGMQDTTASAPPPSDLFLIDSAGSRPLYVIQLPWHNAFIGTAEEWRDGVAAAKERQRRWEDSVAVAQQASRAWYRERARADSVAEARRTTEQRRALAARRAELRQRGWSVAVVENVLARKVAIGMTAAQVRATWGEPERINETVTANVTLEQWVYDTSYVYLRNGRVSAIQTSR